MTVRQQWAIVGAVLLLLGGGLVAAMHFLGDQLFPVTIGSNAPDFHAKVLGTNRYKGIRDYEGKVVLLNIWATWCPPCRREMPSIERLYEAYGSKGLHIVAVSIDDAATDAAIRAYADTVGATFEILHDPTHDIEREYQTTGYPETFVIDSDGTIRKKWIGADDWNSPGNRALVAQLLGLQPPSVVAESTDVGSPAHLRVAGDTAHRAGLQ